MFTNSFLRLVIATTCVVLFVKKATCLDPSDKLLSVIVIYRHGDRTPIHPYPTDPYRNASFWPVGFGQLTNRGKLQHYQLGKWLRERYNNFLPLSYSEQDIYVRSTDVDRTLMSAEANLAGLYPPIAKQMWTPNLNWQPIPIHTMPEKKDAVLAMKKPCPKYEKLQRQLFKSGFFRNITHKNHDLYAYLTRYSGYVVNSLETLEHVYNTLFIEDINNFTLPDWTRNVYPQKLKEWAEMSFATACYTPELARLKTGPLFKEMLDFLQKPTRRMIVYSAHDTTVANVLMTMGVFQYHSPPFASTILIELHQSPTTRFVNVLYKNSSVVQQIKLGHCQFNCNLDDFVDILKPITIGLTDWEIECKLAWFYMDNVEYLLFILIFFLGLFTLLSIVLIMLKRFQRKNEILSYTQLPNDEIA